MDSNMMSPVSSHQKYKNIIIPDDSGYFTPCSAESTINGDSICRDVSFDTSYNCNMSNRFETNYNKPTTAVSNRGILGNIREQSLCRQNAFEEDMDCDIRNINSIDSMEIDISQDLDNKNVIPLKDELQSTLQKTPSNKSNCLGFGDKKTIRSQLSKPEKNKLKHDSSKIVKSIEKRKVLKHNLLKEDKKRIVKSLDFFEKSNENDERIDILKHLYGKDSLIKNIFEHCDGEVLQNIYNVNILWRKLVEYDKNANETRKSWLNILDNNKENDVPNVKSNKEKIDVIHKMTVFRQNNSQTMSMEKVEDKNPPTSPGTKKINKFYETAQSHSSRELRKCPNCSMPAVLKEEKFVCEGLTCKTEFCKMCHGVYDDGDHNCSLLESHSPNRDQFVRCNSYEARNSERAKKNQRNKFKKIKRRLNM